MTWSELTIFFTKSREKCPISYGKFQHDSPNGVASSLEKLMGVASTPLTGRGLTCRPIGMRSSASRSPSAVMHLRYRLFRHRCPFKQCRPSKQSAPDRCSVPLLFTWLRPCQKCNAIIISIGRMRKRLPYCSRCLLMEALVNPHIRYCAAVWGGCNKTQKTRLQKVLDFTVRIVVGLRKFDHVSDSRDQFTWCKLENIIDTQDCSLIKRTLTNPSASKLLREKLVSRAVVSSRHTRATTEGLLQ